MRTPSAESVFVNDKIARMSHSPAPQFGAIIIGDEILSGKRQDKHLPKLIELLAARGCSLSWAEYVGDERTRLTEVLRRAVAGNDIAFSFGGIGATPDDHTRQCTAAALGVALQPHPQAQALITQRMQEMAAEKGEAFAPQRPDNVQRLQMAMLPAHAHIIPNPYNKIPGFSCASPGDRGAIHCVPVAGWTSAARQRFPHCHHRRGVSAVSVLCSSSLMACISCRSPATSSRSAFISAISASEAIFAVSFVSLNSSRSRVSPCLNSPYTRISSLVSTTRPPSASVRYDTRPFAISRYRELRAFPVSSVACLTVTHAIVSPRYF